jgi:hypothetical protein
MNSLEKQVRKLKLFLSDNDIEYSNVNVGYSSKVLLKDGCYISNRSTINKRLAENGICMEMLEVIINLLSKISLEYEYIEVDTEYEKEKAKIVMTKTDKTIVNESLNVVFSDNSTFGGYTDSRQKIVVFDPKHETYDQFKKIVPGINYHELGHVLFTPSFEKLKDDILEILEDYDPQLLSQDKQIIDSEVKSILRIVNVFEDGRMESLMSIKHPFSMPYFKKTVNNFLITDIQARLDHGETINECDCVIVSGRKYLDKKIRVWIYEKFKETNPDVEEEKVKRINIYTNKFVSLVWSENLDEMLRLCISFYYEFLKDKQQNNSSMSDMLDEMLKNMESQINKISKYDNVVESEIEKNISEKLSEQLKKVDGENIEEKEPDDEVRQLIENDDKENDENIEDKERIFDKKVKETNLKQQENDNYNDRYVTSDMFKERIKLERSLQEYSRRCRNGYTTRKRKGVVDVNEARRQSYKRGTKIFKQYKRNVSKSIDLEIVFALDCSYSMSNGSSVSKIMEASKQLWIASTACEGLGAKVTHFTFSDEDLGVFKHPEEKNKYRVPKYVNGTYIGETMFLAENHLDCSKKENKWFIALTDGQISDVKAQNHILRRMKDKGICCGKINLYTPNEKKYAIKNSYDDEYDHIIEMIHDGHGNININDNENIVSFFKKIYEISINNVGR